MGIIQIQGHSLHPRFLNERSVVFDLGGNHGAFSRKVVSQFRCRCVAVEANGALAREIQGLPGVEVVHACIGKENGTVDLAITKNDQCSSMLTPQTSPVLRRETVPLLSLTSLLTRCGVERVDLLKMDIEGAEMQVLNAIPDAQLRRIAQLTIEFHDALGMTSLEEIRRITQRLEALGFAWIRGSFWNFEDNLFLNRSLCPTTAWELWVNRNVFRVWNGVKRVARRRWSALGLWIGD